MNARRFTEAELEALHEPTFQPHLHRMWMGNVPAPVAVAVATQRDGTLRLLPTSTKPLLAKVDDSGAAEEGGQFREPVKARVHVNDEGPQDKGASWRESLVILGTPAAILLAVFAVLAYRTWLA